MRRFADCLEMPEAIVGSSTVSGASQIGRLQPASVSRPITPLCATEERTLR